MRNQSILIASIIILVSHIFPVLAQEKNIPQESFPSPRVDKDDQILGRNGNFIGTRLSAVYAKLENKKEPGRIISCDHSELH